MSRIPFAVGYVCVALLAVPAFGAEVPPATSTPEPPAEQLIDSLTVSSLSSVLTEAGAEDVTSSLEDNVVLFKSGGRNFFVALSACDEGTNACALASIGRAIRGKLPLEVLNKINEKYTGLVSATRVNETTFKLLHATIVGGGVSRKNLAINLVWYVNETPEFESFIKSQLVAANPAYRPDIQNVGAGLPLGDVVLSPGEIAALVDKLNLSNHPTSIRIK